MKRNLLLLLFIASIFGANLFGQTCTGPLTVTVNGSGTGLPLSSSITGVNILCHNQTTGSVDLTVAGGTLPYSYAWTNGATSQDLTGLGAGTYAVTITDGASCTSTQTITLTQPAAPITPSIAGVNVLCFGNTTGSADLSVTGGTGAYTYLWSNNATTQDLSGLAAGTYSVTITDANLCTAVASVTITQPAAALAGSIVGTNITCFGASTGAATLTVSGGTSGYTYLWSNGATTQNLTGVVAGSYSVVITDANGCTANASIVITQAPAIVAGTCDVSNDQCQVGAGQIKVAASGGTGILNVTWSGTPQSPFGGPVTGSPAGTANPIPTTGPTAGYIIYSNLSGNTQYKFKVTDANGCFVGEN
jgi:large repetitive protein